MECGETLAKRLEKGPLPLEQVLRYGAQITDALDTHRAGIVHAASYVELTSREKRSISCNLNADPPLIVFLSDNE